MDIYSKTISLRIIAWFLLALNFNNVKVAMKVVISLCETNEPASWLRQAARGDTSHLAACTVILSTATVTTNILGLFNPTLSDMGHPAGRRSNQSDLTN